MSSPSSPKKPSPRNRTLKILPGEKAVLKKMILPSPRKKLSLSRVENKLIAGDLLSVIPFLPEGFADLLILDPPYNLDKDFGGKHFSRTTTQEYLQYLESFFPLLLPLLKKDASIYLCGDWQSSAAQALLMEKYLICRSRISWQREKGRAASRNWKNCCEDIWFGTLTKEYYFNAEAVKVRKKVIAPYRDDKGKPRDWMEVDGEKYRLTGSSNFWDDITIPYWSMPENTPHPTQKPEKLIAKLILASCPEGGFVLDPFAGSCTSCVAAKKLNRRFLGIDCNKEYLFWGAKRLLMAEENSSIQGYEDGVFYERNSKAGKKRS